MSLLKTVRVTGVPTVLCIIVLFFHSSILFNMHMYVIMYLSNGRYTHLAIGGMNNTNHIWKQRNLCCFTYNTHDNNKPYMEAL